MSIDLKGGKVETMRFIFIRHGHYDGKGRPREEKDKLPLNEAGRASARAAGEFLRQQGITPDVVITTETERTRETARLLLEAAGASAVEPRALGGGFGQASLDKKLGEWLAGIQPAPAVALFVGHNTSQDYCVRHLEGTPKIPRENRACVLVYEGEVGRGWRCVGSHLGLPR